MSLNVLLRRTIEGVGDVGDVVRVKPGFARNFLLPRGYAALVTADALLSIEKDKTVEAKRQAELSKANAALIEKLRDMTLNIEVRAGEDGHLYGSVTARDVIAAFAREGYKFQERQVRFETVRELGEYTVVLQLSREHQVDVSLWVVQDVRDIESMKAASEAAALAAAAGEGEDAEGAEGEGAAGAPSSGEPDEAVAAE